MKMTDLSTTEATMESESDRKAAVVLARISSTSVTMTTVVSRVSHILTYSDYHDL